MKSSIRHTLAVELEGGGKLVFIEKETARLRSPLLERSLRRAQELVRQYIPNGDGIVDEFIAERRAEAAQETKDGTVGDQPGDDGK